MRIHGMKPGKRLIPALITVTLASLLLMGCEYLFTNSPVSFLQRPVSSLSEEQQVEYGKDALASGDTDKMEDAYEVLSENTDSKDAQYVAAQLGVELSGISEYLVAAVADSSSLPSDGDTTELEAFVAEHGLSPAYLVSAAENMTNAQALGEPLTPMDYVMGSLGLALGTAQATSTGGSYFDFSNATTSDLAPAQAMSDAGLAAVSSLDPSDPARQLLEAFNDYIAGIH